MLFKKKEKVNRDYPTKEEFERIVQDDQQKELESGRFQTLEAYLEIINESSHLDKQEYLLSLIGNYNDDHIDEINNGYFYTKEKKLNKYKLLSEFINSLTDTECEENYYLFLAKTLFKLAKDDCEYYVTYYINNKNNNKKNSQEFNFDLSKEVKNLIPVAVPTTVAHAYYKPEVYKVSYDPILPKKNIQIYYDFNAAVRIIQKMLADIFDLELWYQLDKNQLDIAINYVNTLINESDRSINICFNDVINNSQKRNYVIADTTAQLLSDHFDKPFTEIVNMSYDELKEFLEQKQVKLKKTN